jgi:hypothetical protein
MTRSCRNCNRTIAAPDGGGQAAFCMYCGSRIAPDPADAPTATHLPADPDEAPTGRRPRKSEPTRPPAEIGGYRLVRCLGVGGMGAVYEAESADGDSRVAVKLLGGKLADDPQAVERFKLEGRVASQIAHPRCVFVLGADAHAGWPYIVMELMPGTTLKDLVDKRGPLPPAEAVAYIMDVAEGLAEAHRLGVIHRDVKPSNCFMAADGRVKVGDFGLAKTLAADPADGHLTQTGAFLGTVLYASPEQIRGDVVGYESDIYSACATLYFLLTGRAPHQHTSLTGALAKAISEPPTPIRSIRRDVPASLERLLLRGLDRTPARRWATADDFRDALRDQMPAAHTPARVRGLVVAYVVDSVPLFVLNAVLTGLVPDLDDTEGLFVSQVLSFAVDVAYFGTAEGWFGTTPGKQLLRLRVARVGETGPPGLARGVWRAAVFAALMAAGLGGIGAAFNGHLPAAVRAAGAVASLAGWALILTQLWGTHAGHRGVHDRLSGCHVVRRPRPADRTKLVSRFPNPLDAARPADGLPAAVGGFTVTGLLGGLPDGGEVWVGQDGSLGRRVLVRVYPPGQEDECLPDAAAARPARLRVVGRGELDAGGATHCWVATLAPAGAPLADVIDPARPLDWADARPLVEQVVDELTAAEADGTGPELADFGQVWVEPGGRLQLVDVPLPAGRPLSAPAISDPLGIVRAVASMALEGTPRVRAGRVRAPVPPHAAAVTDKLFGGPAGGYGSLADLRADLAGTHAHPPRVDRPMRAAHLGVQAALLSFGLALAAGAAGAFALMVAGYTASQLAMARATQAAVADPARQAALATAVRALPDASPARKLIGPVLDPARVGEVQAALGTRAANLERALARQRRGLTAPERAFLDNLTVSFADDRPLPAAVIVQALPGVVMPPELSPEAEARQMRVGFAAAVTAVVAGVVGGWVGFAFALRGGLALTLAGITVLRADGRRAGRLRCAVREAVVWLPVAAALLAGVWVHALAPVPAAVRVGLWLAAVSLLPLYVFLALRTPARPPHDRLLGTVLVPV